MIIDGVFYIFNGIISVLLLPLQALNVTVDFIANISFVNQFITISAFLLPWDKLLPLLVFTITIFTFRIVISIIKLILDFIPFV